MDLKDKLKYYDPGAIKKEPDNRTEMADLYKRLDATPVDPNAADVLKIEKFFSYTHFCHEFEPYSGTEIKLPLLSRNRLTGPVNLSDILIFDLETTGLAGGAGTFPFLVGLGVFEEEGIRVYQYFLPEYGREVIAYLDILQNFKSKAHLLTYNGKTYDYPLIKNRFILNRIDDPFSTFQHIDLLHFTRRLWKSQLPNCSLSTVEQEIFKFHRYGDIEGWLIPQAYFDFLQTGYVKDIQKIIHHNQQDILSLGRLLMYMHLMEMDDAEKNVSDSELQILFNLAVRNADSNRIAKIYHQIQSRNILIPQKSAVAYSLYLKGKNRWPEAIQTWMNMLESQMYVLFALEELAKYFEHIEKDYLRAQEFTQRGIKYLDLMQELQSSENDTTVRSKFEHRLERIMRKISGQGE